MNSVQSRASYLIGNFSAEVNEAASNLAHAFECFVKT